MGDCDQQHPHNAPPACPGVKSDSAGRSDACQGCPNQSLCSSGQAGQEYQKVIDAVQQKFETVKGIFLIMSGKGGVGKSTVAMLLAKALTHNTSYEVGFLDVDICGPSAGRLFSISGDIHKSAFGFSPLVSEEGISIMSSEFLLGSKQEAVIWRGPKKNGLIKEFILGVDWGNSLDYLIIDTPPGTTDEHLSLVNYLKYCPQVSAILVCTPQEVSLVDVRKQITFLNKAGVRIQGIVENMSCYICPNCKGISKLFPESTVNKGTSTDTELIARIPFTKHISFLGAVGTNPFDINCGEDNPLLLTMLDLIRKMGIHVTSSS